MLVGLLFFLFLGKNAPDDLRLSALELKQNFKLMMVGSLEADIQDVQNTIDNRDVIDDFDDDNDERTTYNFHKMEVCVCKMRCVLNTSAPKLRLFLLFMSNSLQSNVWCRNLYYLPVSLSLSHTLCANQNVQ